MGLWCNWTSWPAKSGRIHHYVQQETIAFGILQFSMDSWAQKEKEKVFRS